VSNAKAIDEVKLRTFFIHNFRLGYGIAAYACLGYPFIRYSGFLGFYSAYHASYRHNVKAGPIQKPGKLSAFPN